jgi:DNA polymerase I-like protein with 3'-5' exonuclease and polymerase domains
MSKETFARETRMSLNEAEEFVESFYKTFPVMTEYLNEIKRRVVQTGSVQSIYGRVLNFDINQSKSNETITARVIENLQL